MLHAEGANNLAMFVLSDSVCATNFGIAGTLGIACRSNESPLTGERVTWGRRETYFVSPWRFAIEIHARVPKEGERESNLSLGSGIRGGIQRTADPIKWYV